MSKITQLGRAISNILIASIPGAVLPTLFFFLFKFNTTATNRDVLPPLNNPLEIIGCVGSIFSSIPIYLMLIVFSGIIWSLSEIGITIPIFDTLSSKAQFDSILIFCLICNVFLWTIPVSNFRNRKRTQTHDHRPSPPE
jgi:hypothetical protein